MLFFFFFLFSTFPDIDDAHFCLFSPLNSWFLFPPVRADPRFSAVTALLLGPGSLIILTPQITPALTFRRSHPSGLLAEYIWTFPAFLNCWFRQLRAGRRAAGLASSAAGAAVVVEMFRQQTGRWRMRPGLRFHRGLMMPVVTTGYSQPPNEGSCDTATRGPI